MNWKIDLNNNTNKTVQIGVTYFPIMTWICLDIKYIGKL